ncbi:hypothetical protein [Marinomonas algicola]|uniref:hypothetical protein n=1 Tax=Marinomonas algicola TaxID=2773454 RepID=UPI00174CCA1A|nr:hypothetical protein [Marinomonas algicola]
MSINQIFNDDQYDLQTINSQLSQSMRKGALPKRINFTELDGLWHVCGAGTFFDWELIRTNNPSIFDLKLPFKEGEIVILGDTPKTLDISKCSLIIQIDLQPLEKEGISDTYTSLNAMDLINLIRVEDPSGNLNQHLHYLSMSICAFLRQHSHAITLCIQALGGLNLQTNLKWLISTFTSEQSQSKLHLNMNSSTTQPNEQVSHFMSAGKNSGILIRTKWLMESLILPVLPKLMSQSAQESDLSLRENESIENTTPIIGYPIKVRSNIYSTFYEKVQIIPTNEGIILEITGKLKLGLNAELNFSIDKQFKLASTYGDSTITLIPDGKAVVKSQKNTRWYNCLDFRSGAKAENLFDIMLETVVNSLDYSFRMLNQHIEKTLHLPLSSTTSNHSEKNSNVLYTF